MSSCFKSSLRSVASHVCGALSDRMAIFTDGYAIADAYENGGAPSGASAAICSGSRAMRTSTWSSTGAPSSPARRVRKASASAVRAAARSRTLPGSSTVSHPSSTRSKSPGGAGTRAAAGCTTMPTSRGASEPGAGSSPWARAGRPHDASARSVATRSTRRASRGRIEWAGGPSVGDVHLKMDRRGRVVSGGEENGPSGEGGRPDGPPEPAALVEGLGLGGLVLEVRPLVRGQRGGGHAGARGALRGTEGALERAGGGDPGDGTGPVGGVRRRVEGARVGIEHAGLGHVGAHVDDHEGAHVEAVRDVAENGARGAVLAVDAA